MNTAQTAKRRSTASAVAVVWSSGVHRLPAHGRLPPPFQSLSAATTPATPSFSLHSQTRPPQFSSSSIRVSHTVLQSPAASPFVESFRHLWAAHLRSGTRRSDCVARVLHFALSRVILSTSMHQRLHSARLMGVFQMRPRTPNHALQRTRPERRGCNPGIPWAGSLSLGRSPNLSIRRD